MKLSRCREVRVTPKNRRVRGNVNKRANTCAQTYRRLLSAEYDAGYIILKGRMFELFARGLVRGGEDLLAAVHRDDSPASFERAIAVGMMS